MKACSLVPGAWSPACVVALLVAMTAGASSQAPVAPAADEAAVRAVVAAYVDAREKRDPAAIGALFTADADQVNSAGEWRRGRDGIVKGTLESSQRNPASRRITLRAIRFPSANVAVADGDYEIGDRLMWTTFTMVRQPEGWKITAIRNALHTSTSPAGSPRR
jgi:uncharacterized protein (TIGR02246 family)